MNQTINCLPKYSTNQINQTKKSINQSIESFFYVQTDVVDRKTSQRLTSPRPVTTGAVFCRLLVNIFSPLIILSCFRRSAIHSRSSSEDSSLSSARFPVRTPSASARTDANAASASKAPSSSPLKAESASPSPMSSSAAASLRFRCCRSILDTSGLSRRNSSDVSSIWNSGLLKSAWKRSSSVGLDCINLALRRALSSCRAGSRNFRASAAFTLGSLMVCTRVSDCSAFSFSVIFCFLKMRKKKTRHENFVNTENQSIDHSMNQSINQSLNQSIYLSIDGMTHLYSW